MYMYITVTNRYYLMMRTLARLRKGRLTIIKPTTVAKSEEKKDTVKYTSKIYWHTQI